MASTVTLQRTINLTQQFLRWAPLTFSGLFSVSPTAGGTGYTVGDTINIGGTGTGGTAQVSTISGGGSTGPVTGLIVLEVGSGYVNEATGVSTTGGTGSGLTVTTVTNSDPAFSNADWVKQYILSPPFAWRWNRHASDSPATPTFVTKIGVTDYSVSLPDFGWLEKGTGYDPSDGYRAFELQVNLIKAQETNPTEPARIAPIYEDGNGNVTFRLFPAPDKVYNIVLEYQKSAGLFTSVTQTWTPIPDYLSYLYNEGFLAKSGEYMNDPRYLTAMQLFLQDLAANAEGLDQSQKNIWLEDRMNSLRQTNAVAQGRL